MGALVNHLSPERPLSMEGLGSVLFTTTCHRFAVPEHVPVFENVSSWPGSTSGPYYVVSVEILTTTVYPVVAKENVS